MKLKKKQKTLLNKFWKNRNSKQRSFMLVVLLPTLLAALYYCFIAAGLYVVESRFAVKGNEMQQFDMLSGLAGIPAQGGSATDSYIVQDYVQSIDIVNAIGKNLDLEAIFNHPDADWLSAMGYQPTLDEQLNYWRKRVSVSYDPTTTIITLKVRAFSARDAKKLAEAVLEKSEMLVNNLSEAARADDLKFADKEVKRAEERVTIVRMAMNDFRNEVKDLDPTQTASAKMMLIGELEVQLAKAQAELNALISYMDETAPAVLTLTRQVKALTQQIHLEKKNITGDSKTQPALSGVFADYEPLLVERTFAEKAYTSAMASLEAARVEAARKHRYLATFVEPIHPDNAVEPKRVKSIATVLIAALMSWAIGLLGLGIIKEHIGWV
ncbi:capsule biosynthesis protein [Vibrio europaeus]|uniref:capsule biosynthesis protein n=1 Tax=Vibrio europaeus TaxID=300876 RepID=UPI0018A7657B|nr:capsule biosynthesis protein [Vibrio europaeus]MDC5812473.1 capsule biosynthesis protein [Vibrio europaeus]QPG33900.1 capsule biosynthesis protein [Vibrio europaeus]